MIYKTTNTTLSTYSNIESPSIQKAKQYLADNFGNQYDQPPHITYSICPFPEYNLGKIENKLTNYFNTVPSFKFTFGELEFDERMRFFYLPVVNSEVLTIHEDITNLSNQFREGLIREKDKKRLRKDYYNEKQKENIVKYGYARVFTEAKLHITLGNIVSEEGSHLKIIEELNNILANTNNTVSVTSVVAHLQKHSLQTKRSTEVWRKVYKLID